MGAQITYVMVAKYIWWFFLTPQWIYYEKMTLSLESSTEPQMKGWHDLSSTVQAVTLHPAGARVEFLSIDCPHDINPWIAFPHFPFLVLLGCMTAHALYTPPFNLQHSHFRAFISSSHVHLPELDHLHGQLFTGWGQLCREPCAARSSDTLEAAFQPQH